MDTNTKEQYMRRCIELAMMGAGNVSTNPMVGAVVVHNGVIIGEGYHRKCGGPHAEVNAINSVRRQELLPESEIYVSLEPCAHFGKTPPCADLIIEKKIRKCYVGCLDPFSKVDGKGIQKLRAASVEVEVGILEKECQDLNRRFFTSVNLKRPYVILKWAQSLDGFIDKDFAPVRISNHQTEIINHKWRSEEDAILVGTNTALRDNPSLTNRLWAGKNPVRVVIDRTLKLSNNLKIFNDEARTIVFTEVDKESSLGSVTYVRVDFDESFPSTILKKLDEMKVQSLIVEGGAMTHKMFIDNGLWDEARIFQSCARLGNGTRAAVLYGDLVSTDNIGDNLLMVYRRRV
ncbi:MAG: bifunctional diaminohydroxyphosphoribosylaminopyrimidine deaminase/5-amino-6-(5-phosphoribosylamino)uracil reductase RibD [Bacteroidales bacterium]|nr:bifunctional diaminohydroxyphosphoribosylaminopyrimidine deaminase/5-amino-6-(5-phosphoribosylamino)uracil reductase RibD [Bacteroidales bacterium]